MRASTRCITFIALGALLCGCGATVTAGPVQAPAAEPGVAETAEPEEAEAAATVEEPETVAETETEEAQVEEPVADPEAVDLGGALGNRFVRAGEASDIIARLTVTGRVLEREHRPPINVALVVDTSGSMDGPPIQAARDACLSFLDALRPGDRLAVVTFGSHTTLLVPSTELVAGDPEVIREQIEAMRASGTTDLAGGLRAGIEQVASSLREEGINRVVLLSDGLPNEPEPIGALTASAAARGISITAFGLGIEFDETLLGALAQATGGRYHYVADASMVEEVFQDEVLRLNRVVGRGASLTLRPGPGITIDSVVGLQESRSGRTVSVGLGDLVEGETRELIVRLTAPGRADGTRVEVLDAELRFDDSLANAGQLERTLFLGAEATSDDEELAAGRDVEVEAAAERMQAAAATVEAVRIARAGDVEAARRVLDGGRERAAVLADALGDEGLAERARDMGALSRALGVAGTSDGSAGGHGSGAAPTVLSSPAAAAGVRAAHDRALRSVLGH